MDETMNEDQPEPSSEHLAERLASADPAEAAPIAEELADRLEAELDRSAEERRAPQREESTEGPSR